MTRKRNKLEAKFLAVLLLAGPASVLAPVAVAAKAAVPVAAMPAQGVITQVSDYGFDETIVRIKGEIATKGIRFFDEIDQTKLGADAKLPIGRSTLLLFGNPPLGVTFLQSNPLAGLDWPVRMLVTEEPKGAVHVHKAVIAHHITGKLAHATPANAPFVEGRRTFLKYQDLGVTAASSGHMRAQVMSATAGMTN